MLVGKGGVAGIAALVGLGLASTHLRAQTAPAGDRMSFEVASIKVSKPGTPGSLSLEHGRFTANSTLLGYVEFAYDLMPSPEQMGSMLAGVPKWVSSDHFEIHALAEGDPTKDQMRLMVQSLLADRFGLQVHMVTAQVPVLALILEKPGETGPKLRPHSEGPPCDVHLASQTQGPAGKTVDVFPPACEQFVAIDKPNRAMLIGYRNGTMDRIATFLSSVGRLGGPVVDQTGMSGRFDFTLEFTPEPRGSPPPEQDVHPEFRTTLQEALREQLGLKLKATKAPLNTLIVDHAERPSEN
jgi:bla regulator protein BlaR1